MYGRLQKYNSTAVRQGSTSSWAPVLYMMPNPSGSPACANLLHGSNQHMVDGRSHMQHMQQVTVHVAMPPAPIPGVQSINSYFLLLV
jgi:hypothetical protein